MIIRLTVAAHLALAATPALGADRVRDAATCAALVATDPVSAREAAAEWRSFGGGLEAGLCEADALTALGAHGRAATVLEALAEAPGTSDAGFAKLMMRAVEAWAVNDDGPRAMIANVRAELTLRRTKMEPGWLFGRGLTADNAAAADWELTAALARTGLSHGSRITLRRMRGFARLAAGSPAGALVDAEYLLAGATKTPWPLRIKAEAEEMLGRPNRAQRSWFRVLDLAPEGPLAVIARRHLQDLALR